jgi:hypothetical protein
MSVTHIAQFSILSVTHIAQFSIMSVTHIGALVIKSVNHRPDFRLVLVLRTSPNLVY